MRNFFFSRLVHVAARRWLALLAVLAVAAGTAFVAWPYARGWYHWQAAHKALARFHNDDARVHLQVCLEVWPESAAVHLLVARAARRGDSFREAFKHLEECRRLQDSPSEEVLLEDQLFHAAGGDLKPHIEYALLDRVPKEPEQAPLILEALARGYMRMYRMFEASNCLERWLELEPDNAEIYFLRGQILRRTVRMAKAVPDFQKALALDPRRDDVRYWLALALLEAGRNEEAIQHLEYLQPRWTDDVVLAVARARCYKGMGQLAEARQILEAVLAGHPNYGPALRTRGEVEQLAGRFSAAEKWLKAAAKIMPNDYQSQWSLHKFYVQQGKKHEAQEVLARVEKLRTHMDRFDAVKSKLAARPNDPALQYEMGMLFVELGETDSGAGWLESAVLLNPSFKQAHAALVDIYRQRGDEEKAALHRQQMGEN